MKSVSLLYFLPAFWACFSSDLNPKVENVLLTTEDKKKAQKAKKAKKHLYYFRHHHDDGTFNTFLNRWNFWSSILKSMLKTTKKTVVLGSIVLRFQLTILSFLKYNLFNLIFYFSSIPHLQGFFSLSPSTLFYPHPHPHPPIINFTASCNTPQTRKCAAIASPPTSPVGSFPAPIASLPTPPTIASPFSQWRKDPLHVSPLHSSLIRR